MRKINVIFQKVFFRIVSFFKHIAYKMLYLNGFKCKWNSVFYPGAKLMIESTGKLEIGKKCFFNKYTTINCMKSIKIGDNCIFGESVHLYDHNHTFAKKDELIREQGYVSKSITIGNNCWIGSNVLILAGVKIGDNVVIGAGTIVTKDIPSNSKVYCKHTLTIKELYDENFVS